RSPAEKRMVSGPSAIESHTTPAGRGGVIVTLRPTTTMRSGTVPFSRTLVGEMLGATLTGEGKTIVTLPRGSPQTMGNPDTPTCTAGDAAATAAAIASTAVTPSSYPGRAALTPFATPTSLSARSCRNLRRLIRR